MSPPPQLDAPSTPGSCRRRSERKEGNPFVLFRAMLGVAGILVGELARPDISFYSAPQQLTMPINIPTLLAIQFILFHYVEVRRWQGAYGAGHRPMPSSLVLFLASSGAPSSCLSSWLLLPSPMSDPA